MKKGTNVAVSCALLMLAGCGTDNLWDNNSAARQPKPAAQQTNDHIYAAHLSLQYGGLMCQTIARQRVHLSSLEDSLQGCELGGAFPKEYCAKIYGQSTRRMHDNIERSLASYADFVTQTTHYFASETIADQAASFSGYTKQFAGHVNSAGLASTNRASYCLK